ncbi:glycosyltransferase [Bacillus sp. FJAT-50079]|uniref:MGDG synthase family glycosyltransferase n=1 Tax=Bacillus sp. FJAT-50079 TaxID=2833577 RepID=UPI001BC9901A|nr:glycosyltransferase [Bacillus sp. FJAT-50079]MBS4210066.1 galactosyldiacylglycerol synthase [Bacillus sp. FJAT-50079]
MRKVLFFPLLRMPSGHHQVADAVAEYISKRDPNIQCKKIDLLSAWNPIVETAVTKLYLKWIHHFPKTYAWMYEQMAHTSNSQRSYHYYEFLFLKKMEKIISEEKPDLIICTHGFPSYIVSKLKIKNQCSVPVINVYTDFFVNDVWGKEGIDYHFVPSEAVKTALINKNGLSENQIIMTGIPISEQFMSNRIKSIKNKKKWNVLISGGSIGLGNILDLLEQKECKKEIEYFVLCGKNKKLFQTIAKLNFKNIHPYSYISSKEEMNEMYDNIDAIITKPGGVTISEAVRKEIPIFIHSALPGQEEINLKLLKDLKLVHELNDKQNFDDQVIAFLNDKLLMQQNETSFHSYLEVLRDGTPMNIYHFINSLIKSGKEDDQMSVKEGAFQ